MRRLGLVASMSLVCALGACADDPEPDADGAPTPSASDPASVSPIPTNSPSEPVGELIEVRNVSLRAPVTWTVRYSDAGVGQGMSLFPPSGAAGNSIAVYVRSNRSTYTLTDSEDFAVEQMRGVEDPNARRLSRTSLGGQPAYHVRGKDEIAQYDHYGAIHNGTSIYINFQLRGTKAERKSIIDEVLNSVEWR